MKQIQKGFTLIELMIVVAIIGILAAVAIPAYQDYVVKAKLSKVQSTMAPIKTALAMYLQEQGGFPATAAAVSTTDSSKLLPANDTGTWTMLGLATFPTLPAEVSAMSYVPGPIVIGGTTSGTFSLILTLAKVRVGSIDNSFLAVSPTTVANDGIDPHIPTGAAAITLPATSLVQGTAMQWYYGCDKGANPKEVDVIVTKYFANPKITGAKNCLGVVQT